MRAGKKPRSMPQLPGLTLLLGGARSGKSARAEALVRGSGLEPVFVATAQALLMKTPLTLSTAKGRVNLVDQTIDLKVHLRARRDSMFDPATVYRIRGPLADPTVSFDPTRFALRTIVGLALTPVDVLGSVLLPLVGDNGSDPNNPCLQTES